MMQKKEKGQMSEVYPLTNEILQHLDENPYYAGHKLYPQLDYISDMDGMF